MQLTITFPTAQCLSEHCLWSLAARSAGHCFAGICYRCFNQPFLPPNLWDRLDDRHQTLPCDRRWSTFMKFGQKFGWDLPPKFGGPKTWNFGTISDNFTTWTRISSSESNKISSIGKQRCKLWTPPEAHWIWCTLVHKWLKIGPDPHTGHSSEDWR